MLPNKALDAISRFLGTPQSLSHDSSSAVGTKQSLVPPKDRCTGIDDPGSVRCEGRELGELPKLGSKNKGAFDEPEVIQGGVDFDLPLLKNTSVTESTKKSESQQSPAETKDDSVIEAIIFSKDRPGQLFAFLSSCLRFVKGVQKWWIIYLATDEESLNGYCETFARLRATANRQEHIRPIRQTNSFHVALDIVVADLKGTADFVWFQVDDAIHYAPLDLLKAVNVMNKNESVLCLHSKLWPGATKCQPRNNAEMLVPPLRVAEEYSDVMIFKRAEGNFDWNYAFDLSGGLYRLSDVCEALMSEPRSSLTGPNRLELSVNEQYSQLWAITRPFSMCMSSPRPVLSLITINRTQSEFTTPVFESEQYSSDAPWGRLTRDIFAYPVDYPKYQSASARYSTVHVGDLYLIKPSKKATIPTTEQGFANTDFLPLERTDSAPMRDPTDSAPSRLREYEIHGLINDIGHSLGEIPGTNYVDATVLLPFRNSERTLARAIQSVLAQDPIGFVVEILLVDDASEDGSVFIAQSFVRRAAGTLQQGQIQGIASVRLVRRRVNRGGVAGVLNFAFPFARGEFIVRMDADDEMVQGRLCVQLTEMRTRPYLGVLGMGTEIVDDDADDSDLPANAQSKDRTRDRQKANRRAPTPNGCALVAWSLFFYCPLVHPSVCIRKSCLKPLVFMEKNSEDSSNVRDVSLKSKTVHSADDLSDTSHSPGLLPNARPGEEPQGPFPSWTPLEDFALWHSLLNRCTYLLDNSPVTGLVLHKSKSSVTGTMDGTIKDVEFARICCVALTNRLGCLVHVSEHEWLSVCRPDRYKLASTTCKGALERIETLLDLLRDSIIREFEHVTSRQDIDKVVQDCNARKLELRAMAAY